MLLDRTGQQCESKEETQRPFSVNVNDGFRLGDEPVALLQKSVMLEDAGGCFRVTGQH